MHGKSTCAVDDIFFSDADAQTLPKRFEANSVVHAAILTDTAGFVETLLLSLDVLKYSARMLGGI